MVKHLLMTLSNAKPGREDEFNDWYDNQHLGDMLAQPGFAAAQRFELSSLADQRAAPFRYLTLFEIEGDDIETALATVAAAPGNPSIVMTDARADERAAWWFSALSDRRQKPTPAAGIRP